MKKWIFSVLFILTALQTYSQKGEYIITHHGDTLTGEIKEKSVYGAVYYKILDVNNDGEKDKNTVYPYEIKEMRMGYRTYLAKSVDDENETSLFDTRERRYLTRRYYLWEVEYTSVNSMGTGLQTVSTSSTQTAYYLEDKNNEGYLTSIPLSKRRLSKFLREMDCNNVAKGVETGYLDHKDIKKVLEEYINRCLDNE